MANWFGFPPAPSVANSSDQFPVANRNHRTPPPDAILDIREGLLGKVNEPVCLRVVTGTS
jgi:hypothetical protein